jgi:hypothetical protein
VKYVLRTDIMFRITGWTALLDPNEKGRNRDWPLCKPTKIKKNEKQK